MPRLRDAVLTALLAVAGAGCATFCDECDDFPVVGGPGGHGGYGMMPGSYTGPPMYRPPGSPAASETGPARAPAGTAPGATAPAPTPPAGAAAPTPPAGEAAPTPPTPPAPGAPAGGAADTPGAAMGASAPASAPAPATTVTTSEAPADVPPASPGGGLRVPAAGVAAPAQLR